MNIRNDLESSLNTLKKKYSDIQLVNEVKSGKEATIYKVIINGQPYALKVYRSTNNLSSRNIYTSGKYFRERSVRRAISKGNKFGKEVIKRHWVRREYYLLEKLYSKGANLPKVNTYTDNSLLMDFIGDLDAAPRLADIVLTEKQADNIFSEIMKSIKIFYENGIVHSDLSSYNILIWKEKPYIIDFPQSADISKNPNAETLLKRDIENISNYFEKYFKIDRDMILKEVTQKVTL